MLFSQFLVNGLIAGAIYSLIATGFSLIYAANRFVHFAHGTIVTIGAYALYSFFVLAGLPFWISSILAVLIAGCTGVACYKLVYRPLKHRNASAAILLIASLAIMIFLENLALFFYGPAVKTLDAIPVQAGIELFGAVITPLQIGIIIISAVLLLVVFLVVRYTKIGKTMRAVSDNPELAAITGIDCERIHTLGFFVGSAIAGIGSVLISLEQNISPLMGTGLIIKGFAASVIGGVTSLPGAVLGSYLLGIVENIGIIWMPSGYKDAIAFFLLLIFLIIRPQGLLGISKGMRETH